MIFLPIANTRKNVLGKTITHGMIYQCQHSITFNPAHDLKKQQRHGQTNGRVSPNHQKILKQKKKNITSPSLFRCTSKKNPPLPKSKKQKTTSPFRGLLVPPPKKKNVWKMILSLFNSSTKHLPPTFFKVRTGTHWEPGQHS